MIAITRTATIAPGKTRDAMAYGQEIARHVKEEHGTTFEMLMPVGRNPARIAWHARLADLAEREALTAKLMADQRYLGIVGEERQHVPAGFGVRPLLANHLN